jgi:hypothetical protein
MKPGAESDCGKLNAHASKVAAALLHAYNEAWCGERLFLLKGRLYCVWPLGYFVDERPH